MSLRTLILTATIACTAAGAAAREPRLVSINPCVDAVLMKVADPQQIAGISEYSQDARATSIPLALAARFHATSGTAEEVVALAPDIVLAGSHVDPSTIAALTRLHIDLIQLGVPDSIAENNAQVRVIAKAAGHPERGNDLVAQTLAAIRAAHRPGAIPALIWQSGGLVPGSGTLPDEMLRIAGFRNMSAQYGLQRWDVLPLEYLVAAPPRVLLSASDPERSDRMLNHPVLARLKSEIEIRQFPERFLHCGGPGIIAALARLSAIRGSL